MLRKGGRLELLSWKRERDGSAWTTTTRKSKKASKHFLPYPALAVVGDEVELIAGLEGKAEAEQEGVVQRGQDVALRERVADLDFV